MNNEKINCFSLFTVIVSLSLAPFYGIFSSYMINKNGTSSFISMLIGFIFSIIISKIILSFFNINSNLSYTKKIKKTYKKVSKGISIISITSSLLCYMLLTYRLTSFLSNEYLINTPKSLILLLILIYTIYNSNKGTETIFRVSTITFYISIIIFLFDFFSLIFKIDTSNYLPISIDIKSILISSIIFSFYFTIPLIHINIINKNQIVDNYNLNKYYYYGITLSFIIIFLSVLTTIGISGININNLFDYPIYTTLKRIRLFSFLDSLENISILLWILFIINSSSIMLSFITKTFNETFNINNKKRVIIYIITFLISFIIPNLIFENNYNESYDYIWFPFIILLVQLLIEIISIIKTKLTNH